MTKNTQKKEKKRKGKKKRKDHQSMRKILDATSPTIQSIPSTKFSPVTALHGSTLQWWDLIPDVSRTCAICSTASAPARSCLLANTSSDAPANLFEPQGREVSFRTTAIIQRRRRKKEEGREPPQVTAHSVPPDSLPACACQHYPQPTQWRQFAQSSSSNTTGWTSAPQRPRY